MRSYQWLFLVLTMVELNSAANILVMLPLPLYSHTNNYMPIFKALAARGHNVTMVSPYPQKTPIPNLNDVVVPDLTYKMFGSFADDVNFVDMDGILFDLIGIWSFGQILPNLAYDCDVVQRFIQDTDSKFDLIITETWFVQETFVAFGHKYNAPVINVAATMISPLTARLTGNQFLPAYVPNTRLPYSDRMSFVERLWNTFYYYWDTFAGNVYLYTQDSLMRKYFKYPGSENLPYLSDLLRNTSLTIMDFSFAVSYPAPFQKNIVEFGGINMKKAEKLPPDLQKFMDTAKDGVIYFSFGSYMNVSAIGKDTERELMSALSKLNNRKIIMKLEESNVYFNEMAKKSNFIVKPWLPQASILAHPNCKLFITHGGLHGLMEGVYKAVPMLAIPLMADQKYNGKFIDTNGIGKVMKLRQLTEQKLFQDINEILDNPIYKKNSDERSAIFKDQPIKTLDNVIYWIEYVIRHKGAPHLRPSAVDLHWYQYLMLDVFAFYSFLLILIIYLIKFVLCMTFRIIKRLCCANKEKTNKKISKKSKKE